MNKRRSSIKSRNRLGTNTLHRRDKTKTRAPRQTPLEEPPARENEKKEKNQTQTNTKFQSPEDSENNNHPHGTHHGGNKKHHRGREAYKPPFPANNSLLGYSQNRRTRENDEKKEIFLISFYISLSWTISYSIFWGLYIIFVMFINIHHVYDILSLVAIGFSYVMIQCKSFKNRHFISALW